MYHSETSWDSEASSFSDASSISFFSYNSDVSVFIDENKDKAKRIAPEKLRYSAQQLAQSSASKHFPTFTNAANSKCAKLHWACHVGWCLCKYQYQPLTPLHLLPNTPIPDRRMMPETRIQGYEIEPGHQSKSPSSNLERNPPESQDTKDSFSTTDDCLIYSLETTV